MENFAFKNEPEWMSELRQQAVLSWKGLDQADESFRAWVMATPASAETDAARTAFSTKTHRANIRETLRSGADAGLCLRRGDEVSMLHLQEDLSAKGVVFMDLEQAIRERPDLVRERLAGLLPATVSNLCVEHYARVDGGQVLAVPDGISVELPFECVSYHSQRPGRGRAYPHQIVVLGRGSSATVVERLYSLDGVFINGGSEFYLGEGATLRFVSVQNLSVPAALCGFYRFRCGADSRLVATFAGLGGQVSHLDIEALMPEPGAECRINGLSFLSGHQQMNWRVALRHPGVRTTSGLQFKTAVKDSARSDFRGTVRIDPGAQQTSAFQSSRSLILSDQAESESQPILEIEANDVHCKHASTTGTLGDDELFYLMSRGLPEAEASRLLIEGFFDPVTTRITQKSVRDEIRELIEEKVGVAG